MVTGDDSQREKGATGRVYKPTEVHKRKVDRKDRPELRKATEAPKRAEPPEPARPVSAGRTQFLDKLPAEPDGTGGTAPVPPVGTGASATAELAAQPAGEGEGQDAEAPGADSEGTQGQVSPDAAGAPPSETEGEKPTARPTARTAKRARRSVWARVAIVAGAVVVVAALTVGGLFAWNRWLRYDDSQDIQGEWYVVGTAVPVFIDAGNMYLTDDVTYGYELNTHDKTIRYTFGPMEGQGRYWFSADRQYLAITDGDGFTSTGTALEDFAKSFQDFVATVSGEGARLPEGEGVIAFWREPDQDALAAQEEAERSAREAEEQAAREEAERIAAAEAAADEAAEQYYYEYYYYEEPAEGEQYYEEGQNAGYEDGGQE